MSNYSPALYLPELEDTAHRDAVLDAERNLRAAGHRRSIRSDANGVYRWACQCGRHANGFGFRAYAEDDWREAHGLDPIVSLMG